MTPRTSWLQRLAVAFAMTGLGAWLLSRTMRRLDMIMLRRSGGRRSLTSMLAGLPLCRLTTTGAKSGLRRETPLLALPYDGGHLAIGSNFGGPKHPGWYHNLRKNPAATLVLDDDPLEVIARQLQGDERERAWQAAVKYYAGYAAYRRRTTRDIGVFHLTPASPSASLA